MTNLSGILPAIVTPFDAEYRVNGNALESLLERLYAAGVHGVYACGQTGEGLLQTVDQRKRVAEIVIANSPKDKHVVIHVGAYRPDEALELAGHASRIGATAISSLPPIGSYSFAEARSYYEALAAASDLPVLVYFFPEVCPAIQTVDQIIELVQIPNIVGLKFTDHNIYNLETLKQTGKIVFSGRDEVLSSGLFMGADGGVGTFYNVVPGLFVQLFDLARQDLWPQARVVQKRINRLIRTTLRFPMLQAVKQSLAWSGIDCDPCLAPRLPLTADEQHLLRAALNESGCDAEVFRLAVAG
jgi:N-acetylneuraminate lyase